MIDPTTKKSILFLPLKAQWYNMIESGVKKEEYREIKPYWEVRLNESKHYDIVCFSFGYSSLQMMFIIDDISIGEGKPEWGAESGKKYFVIHLGARIS